VSESDVASSRLVFSDCGRSATSVYGVHDPHVRPVGRSRVGVAVHRSARGDFSTRNPRLAVVAGSRRDVDPVDSTLFGSPNFIAYSKLIEQPPTGRPPSPSYVYKVGFLTTSASWSGTTCGVSTSKSVFVVATTIDYSGDASPK
jgi:hypothetical protein